MGLWVLGSENLRRNVYQSTPSLSLKVTFVQIGPSTQSDTSLPGSIPLLLNFRHTLNTPVDLYSDSVSLETDSGGRLLVLESRRPTNRVNLKINVSSMCIV